MCNPGLHNWGHLGILGQATVLSAHHNYFSWLLQNTVYVSVVSNKNSTQDMSERFPPFFF